MSVAPGFSIISLLILLAMAAAIIAGVVLIVLGLVGRNKPSTTEGGVCGRCGYSVKGLESLNCPECGADLREVGIQHGGSNTGRNVMLILGIVLVGSTTLCCCSGFLLAGYRSVPNVQTPTPSPAPAPVQPATPTNP